MKCKSVFASTLLISIGCAAAGAEGVETSKPAIPATQPAQLESDIPTLIRQLGDDNFRVRQNASRQLRKLGKSALPALREAEKSKDLEIKSRASELLKEIEHPLVYTAVPQATGNSSQSVRISETNGVKSIDVDEDGRTTHIDVDPTGIRMKVTGQLNGQQVTREFKAENPEQLKKENPAAFELYNQFANGDDGNRLNVGIIQGNVRIQINNGGVIQQLRAHPRGPTGDDIARLREKLLTQMADARISDADQEKVKGLLKQLEETLPPAFDAGDKDINARMREYNARSDALRKELDALKLPDPGDALPPPLSGRLGISATEESVPGEGLVVTHVLPDSRAQKMGLKEQDVIQKVNGQPIHATRELRKLVTDHPKSLVIEGLRDGKPFKVQE